MPNGRIIFTGLRSSNHAGLVFTVRPYGTERRPLATQPGNVLGAIASHDGTKLVYLTRDFNLYTSLSDGSNSTALVGSDPAPLAAPDRGKANDPEWSPDDRWVVFDFPDARRGVSDIYVIREDGSEKTRLTKLGTACYADWGAIPKTS